MEKKIVVTKRFRKNVHSIYEYLRKEFSSRVALQFLEYVEEKLEFIANHPDSGRVSLKRTDVRCMLFLPHNKIFYRVKADKIELLCVFDMRKDPRKSRY